MSKIRRIIQRAISVIILATALGLGAVQPAISQRAQAGRGDPLPSWNDGAVKRRIIDFVTRVTREGSPDFVPVADRIATFDNDGTLWVEKPLPVEVYFILTRVRELAAKDPTFKERQPFKAALEGDAAYFHEAGAKAVVELLVATETGMSQERFAADERSMNDGMSCKARRRASGVGKKKEAAGRKSRHQGGHDDESKPQTKTTARHISRSCLYQYQDIGMEEACSQALRNRRYHRYDSLRVSLAANPDQFLLCGDDARLEVARLAIRRSQQLMKRRL